MAYPLHYVDGHLDLHEEPLHLLFVLLPVLVQRFVRNDTYFCPRNPVWRALRWNVEQDDFLFLKLFRFDSKVVYPRLLRHRHRLVDRDVVVDQL